MRRIWRLLLYVRPYALYSLLSVLLMAVVGAMAAFRLGGVEAREGRLPDARRWYEQAVTWDETMNEARYALARTEAQMGDLQAAATQVSLLTGASPEDPEVRAAVAPMARSAAGGSTTASRPAP